MSGTGSSRCISSTTCSTVTCCASFHKSTVHNCFLLQISSYQCSLDVEGIPQSIDALRTGNNIMCAMKAVSYIT